MDLIPSPSLGDGAHPHPVPTFIPLAVLPAPPALVGVWDPLSPSQPPALPCPPAQSRGCPSSCRDNTFLTAHQALSAPHPELSSPSPAPPPVPVVWPNPLIRAMCWECSQENHLGVKLPFLWHSIPQLRQDSLCRPRCHPCGAIPGQGSVTRADIPEERDREFFQERSCTPFQRSKCALIPHF